MEIPIDINNKISLYDKCLINLAKRESNKLNIHENDLYNFWMSTCWLLYKNRFTDGHINIDDVISIVSQEITGLNKIQEIKFNLFNTLFNINVFNEINGAIHEQFLEFLVAKLFNTSLLSDNQPNLDFFKIVLRPEINRIIRTIWSHESENNKDKIMNKLWGIYDNLLTSENAKDISIRTHVIYHIGRMPHEKSSEFLNKAIELEKNRYYISYNYMI